MSFLHPYSRYGLALVMYKEGLESITQITPSMVSKYIEDGLNHFRMSTQNEPEIEDILKYNYINMQTIMSNNLKGNPKKGIYLCPNITTTDIKATNTWTSCLGLIDKLKLNPNFENQNEKITMGIAPIAGEINNGTKSKKNANGSILEAAACAITTITNIKPCFGYKEKNGKLVNSAIIPDLEIEEMITFIQFYNFMLNGVVNNDKLLTKKVYKKEGVKPKFSRPRIFDGNFKDAPYNSAFGIVGLLGAIGKWSKEARYHEKGIKVLDSLKNIPLYLVQYGNAQVVTINHIVIELAKDNKLSDIVIEIQNSELIHPFEKRSKGEDSRKEIFYLLSSRFLQSFNLPSFRDFLSIRAQYSSKLIVLFNLFFEKEMGIRKEIVHSVKVLGLWLNSVAYRVGIQESEKQKTPDTLRDVKAKVLVELESSVFGARKPSEILNVIVRAGRLTGMDAPSESDIFQEAVLTEEITMDEAKSMLMAFARTRNPKIKQEDILLEPNTLNDNEQINFVDDDVTE